MANSTHHTDVASYPTLQDTIVHYPVQSCLQPRPRHAYPIAELTSTMTKELCCSLETLASEPSCRSSRGIHRRMQQYGRTITPVQHIQTGFSIPSAPEKNVYLHPQREHTSLNGGFNRPCSISTTHQRFRFRLRVRQALTDEGRSSTRTRVVNVLAHRATQPLFELEPRNWRRTTENADLRLPFNVCPGKSMPQ